jgi:sulfate transport system ATP-binding protein
MSIQVRDIQKNFGDYKALDSINLDFPKGELVALLGPSGCGKTTLLRIIVGLEHSDHGQILLEGEDSSNAHVRDRQVGFVFQHYALFKHMTVFENVAFGMRMKPKKQRLPEAKIQEKVHQLLNLVQLDWLADRFPAQLSGGQRQRIALARALAVEPRVLLLDEPFGALDAKVRKELRRWLRQLHDELHITSIFVTHDQEEALEVADKVVLMNQGRVEQVGTPQEVYQKPATSFVYSFLGSVNQFHGRVEGSGLKVGGDLLSLANSDIANGKNVLAFARPHELEILTDTARLDGVSARVNRVLSFGLSSRVELSGLEGYKDQHFEVEISRDQAEAYSLQPHQLVKLKPSSLRLFEHQSIA